MKKIFKEICENKLEKAEKLGIRIVNEEEFLGMIGE